MDLEKLEAFCKTLPGTTLDIKWEKDLCFLVGKKMYCVTGLDHPFGVSLKVTPQQFDELTVREGIEPAHYVARYHWVAIHDGGALSPKEWEFYIRQSYDLVFSRLPKKVQREALAQSPAAK